MKTLEYHAQGTWYGRLWDEFNNWLAVDVDGMWIWGWAWDSHGPWVVNDTREHKSNFWNGYVMLRLCWPLGVFVHLKPLRNRRIQFGAGWKVNGRFTLTFRVQSDESAARGTHSPNHGQASGWDRGTA